MERLVEIIEALRTYFYESLPKKRTITLEYLHREDSIIANSELDTLFDSMGIRYQIILFRDKQIVKFRSPDNDYQSIVRWLLSRTYFYKVTAR